MHWEYSGFLAPLLVFIQVILLIRERLKKRPPHNEHTDDKKRQR